MNQDLIFSLEHKEIILKHYGFVELDNFIDLRLVFMLVETPIDDNNKIWGNSPLCCFMRKDDAIKELNILRKYDDFQMYDYHSESWRCAVEYVSPLHLNNSIFENFCSISNNEASCSNENLLAQYDMRFKRGLNIRRSIFVFELGDYRLSDEPILINKSLLKNKLPEFFVYMVVKKTFIGGVKRTKHGGYDNYYNLFTPYYKIFIDKSDALRYFNKKYDYYKNSNTNNCSDLKIPKQDETNFYCSFDVYDNNEILKYTVTYQSCRCIRPLEYVDTKQHRWYMG